MSAADCLLVFVSVARRPEQACAVPASPLADATGLGTVDLIARPVENV